MGTEGEKSRVMGPRTGSRGREARSIFTHVSPTAIKKGRKKKIRDRLIRRGRIYQARCAKAGVSHQWGCKSRVSVMALSPPGRDSPS